MRETPVGGVSRRLFNLCATALFQIVALVHDETLGKQQKAWVDSFGQTGLIQKTETSTFGTLKTMKEC